MQLLSPFLMTKSSHVYVTAPQTQNLKFVWFATSKETCVSAAIAKCSVIRYALNHPSSEQISRTGSVGSAQASSNGQNALSVVEWTKVLKIDLLNIHHTFITHFHLNFHLLINLMIIFSSIKIVKAS